MLFLDEIVYGDHHCYYVIYGDAKSIIKHCYEFVCLQWQKRGWSLCFFFYKLLNIVGCTL